MFKSCVLNRVANQFVWLASLVGQFGWEISANSIKCEIGDEYSNFVTKFIMQNWIRE